jgi:hypothetical protein
LLPICKNAGDLLVINRSLVYGGLSVLILLAYALGVGALGLLLGSQYGVAEAVGTTFAVAVLFQPVRAWLQRGANRLMYGERDDPVAVLTRLGHRLEATQLPEAVLPAVVETVAQTLRLPYVAITVQQGVGFRVLAKYPAEPTPWPKGDEGRPIGTTAPASLQAIAQVSAWPRCASALRS